MELFKPEVINKIIDNIEYFISSDYTPCLPIYTNTCYFCISNKHECDNCSYGKEYGICESDENSVWSQLKRLSEKLDGNCINDVQKYHNLCRRYITYFDDCKTVNEVMLIKQKFIIDVTYLLYINNENLKDFIDYVSFEYWKDKMEHITITKDSLKPEIVEKLERYNVFKTYGNEIRQYEVDKIEEENSNLINFGDRIIIRLFGSQMETFILSMVDNKRAALISINDGNRLADAVECEFIHNYKDVCYSISVKEFEKKLLGSVKEYTIERKK